MFRYERPKTDLLGVMDTIFILWEFVIPEHQGKGVGLMYRMMEYHRDPECTFDSYNY